MEFIKLQRQVRTSELMMLDRLFLANEQQSLIRLRQEAEEAQFLEMNAMQEPEMSPTPHANQAMRYLQHMSQNHQNQFGQGHNQHLQVNQQGFPSGHSPRLHQNLQSHEQSVGQNRNSHQTNHSHVQQGHLPSQNHHHQNQSPGSFQSNHVLHQSGQGQNQSHGDIHVASSHHASIQNQANSMNIEEYDEWTCIQRELGVLPSEDNKHNLVEPAAHEHANNNSHIVAKRSASSDSRLETLKRFRVDKHHKKTTDGVHNSVSVVQSVSNSLPLNTHLTMTGQSCMTGRYHNTFDGQSHNYNSLETEEGIEGKSLDEQVQSAIDSILNLQQNTALDLDSILS